ncbi:DUF4350 domain-containing protein [Embleya sp. NBC_00896]|uniref:DUF4350 domain-containing protein n=1 Tax=Embleya sp. NBC_00896 TaxID=2975961 RepID=UPI00386BFF9C|nr:DUF4350 domain-containing protein [Embleya sp. NBC_00896]
MSVALSPTTEQVWRRMRIPLGLFALVLIVVSALVLIRGDRHQGRLDPRSTGPQGTKALARLLAAQGVDVTLARSVDEAARAIRPDTTLVLPFPGMATDAQLRAFATAAPARTVLVRPGEAALAILAPGVHTAADATRRTLDPRCALPAAVRAGNADTGGVRFDTDLLPGATGCYPHNGRPTLVLTPPSAGHDTVVLGSGTPLVNDRLDDNGNAALALNLLGAHPHLVWYLPGDGELPPADDTLWDLLPAGWRWGTAQLAIAAVLLALWRARRLGPVVAEPLPVVVRAAETVEGRARLYRRGRARDTAAELLRAATRERLTSLLGGTPTEAALVAALTTRTGRTSADVHALLYGAIPESDDALVTLADELDALIRQVRTT